MLNYFKSKKIELSLLLISGLANWQLLVINSISWDSLIQLNAKLYGDYEPMRMCIFNTGRRMGYYISVFIFQLPYSFVWLKLLTVIALGASTLLLFKIYSYFFEDKPLLNWFITSITVCLPIYTLAFEPIAITYTLASFLFLLACYLYLYQYPLKLSVKKMVLLSLISVIYFWSYEIQSFYLYTYLFLLAIVLKSYNKKVNYARNIIASIKSNSWLILLPVICFFLWKVFFPISGDAKAWGYNQINFSIASFFYHFGFTLYKLLIALPWLLTQLVFHNFISSALLFIATFIALLFIKKNIENVSTPFSITKQQFIVITVFAFLLFFVSILPYSLVGKDYGALNRNNRNGLLLCYPIGLLIGTLLFYFIKEKKLLLWIGTFLITISIVSTNLSYLYWQGVYIRFQKVELLLKENLSSIRSKYVIVKEETNNPMHQYFTFYEYNFLFKKIVGAETYLAMDAHSGKQLAIAKFLIESKSYRKIFMFNEFNNHINTPSQITLYSEKNCLLEPEKFVWKYWLNGYQAVAYPMQLKFEK